VALVEQLVQENLGRPVAGAAFATKSVGAVFGLELASGEAVVLKLYDKTQSRASLAAVHRCMARVVEAGVPAPTVLSDVFVTQDGIPGAFYELIDGESRDGHQPAVRKALAQVLARPCQILSDEPPSELPSAPTRGDVLWPAPHRSFLSLEGSHSQEAEWMDQIGRRAQAAIKAQMLGPLPVHSDWGVKNARFRGDAICAVYDWDSLVVVSEAEMVGRASIQFTAQWDFPARLTPDPAEVTAFVADYEEARARPFSSLERQVVEASATYSVAQIARLELAARIERDDGFAAMLRARCA
jgi:Ser/Thr protein kinase RdoA (MazF antagonist)